MLHQSDIYVLAGLLAEEDGAWTYRELARELGIPHPLVQRALQRAEEAGLYSGASRSVHLPNVEEFLLHGLRFLAPGKLGSVVAGDPAAWAAPPMARLIHESADLPPVWPASHGRLRGLELPPLHEAAVEASERLPRLAELLSIIDSLRAGDVRVRSVAGEQLRKRLREKANHSLATA
jgi:DNA-binding transcriptional MocR family regulator